MTDNSLPPVTTAAVLLSHHLWSGSTSNETGCPARLPAINLLAAATPDCTAEKAFSVCLQFTNGSLLYQVVLLTSIRSHLEYA